jgi:hypothetical protein
MACGLCRPRRIDGVWTLSTSPHRHNTTRPAGPCAQAQRARRVHPAIFGKDACVRTGAARTAADWPQRKSTSSQCSLCRFCSIAWVSIAQVYHHAKSSASRKVEEKATRGHRLLPVQSKTACPGNAFPRNACCFGLLCGPDSLA